MNKDALYYPYIEFRDPALIKAMSMFYENIYRISSVPTLAKPEAFHA